MFQLDCHLAPNLIVTLKRMVKFLTAHVPTVYPRQHTHVDGTDDIQ